MKKKIRILSLLLCVILVLGCLTGCSSKTEEPAADTPSTDTAPKDTSTAEAPATDAPAAEDTQESYLPLVKDGEEVTLTIGLMQRADVEDYDSNYFTAYLEEKTGINLEFVYFSSDVEEVNTQLALMISGGEKLPDILWSLSGVDISAVYEYGEDGYFIDLRDYFETSTHFFDEVYALMSENAQANLFALGTDPNNGAFYAFPEYRYSMADACETLVTINKDWLDAVGAEKPTTVDELCEVLQKFASEDPNGNGQADEIPMIGYNGYRSDISQYLVNAFVYCNDEYFFNATDGQLWVPYTTDEYRQAMILLNKLVSEGLLSSMTYTIAQYGDSEMTAIYTPADGTAIAGVVGGHPTLCTEPENEVLYQYDALPPLQAETELGGYAPFMSDTYLYSTFITSDCENPELAFKLLDFMCSQDAFFTMRYGEEGVDWEYATDSTTVYGYPAAIKVNSSLWGKQQNKNWNCTGSSMQLTNIWGTAFEDNGSWNSARSKLNGAIRQGYDSCPTPDEVVFTLIYNEEENEVVSDVATVLKDYVKEARSLFATGVMDPNNDADWQAYLDALENQGLSQYLEVSQTAYSRMHEA